MKNKTPVPLGKSACPGPRPAASGHLGWHRGLQIELGCLLCWFATTSGTAQELEPVAVVASLTVSPAELLKRNLQEPADPWAVQFPERRNGGIIKRRRALTEGEAWTKFEAEYRQPRNPSAVKRQLETAKYRLDVTVYSVDRFVKNVRERVDFSFDQGRLRHTRADSRDGFLANPRVKLDLDTTSGKPFIGARVVIPFGN